MQDVEPYNKISEMEYEGWGDMNVINAKYMLTVLVN